MNLQPSQLIAVSSFNFPYTFCHEPLCLRLLLKSMAIQSLHQYLSSVLYTHLSCGGMNYSFCGNAYSLFYEWGGWMHSYYDDEWHDTEQYKEKESQVNNAMSVTPLLYSCRFPIIIKCFPCHHFQYKQKYETFSSIFKVVSNCPKIKAKLFSCNKSYILILMQLKYKESKMTTH